MKLPHRLVEILDILCHCGRGYRFPRFFNDECFASFLDTHFLEKDIHDNQHDDREQQRVILYLVNLKDDELLLKQRLFEVIVERMLQFAAPIELFENGREVVNIKHNLLVGHQLRYAFHGKFIISIEGQGSDPHFFPPVFHPVNLLFYALKVSPFHQFRHQAYQLAVRSCLLAVRCRLVPDQLMQFLHLPLYLGVVFLLLLGQLEIQRFIVHGHVHRCIP